MTYFNNAQGRFAKQTFLVAHTLSCICVFLCECVCVFEGNCRRHLVLSSHEITVYTETS